ncbi:transcriptional regulator, AraC family protein [Grimontia indica]|uniref:Transcriptional regulator, AraC family protein n=2 Tax=Grimontia indica TaxID=1056512 RepID=R1GTB0_9GAMM|nr:transcriptional regulator, AraC family protein [Grimontia indica]
MISSVCGLMNIQAQGVLERAQLSNRVLHADDKGVDVHTYFRIWDVMASEYSKPDFPVRLGEVYARAPLNPAIFAFSCSQNLTAAFHRLAVFKPLMGPFGLKVMKGKKGLTVEFVTANPTVLTPPSFALMELIYFVSIARLHTGLYIKPKAASAPSRCALIEEKLECRIDVSRRVTLSFSLEDADRVLISSNESFWREIEPSLKRQLSKEEESDCIVDKVKLTLQDALPSGDASAEGIARRLNVSKRTLQRRLSQESTTYKSVLEETRILLAKHYLDNTTLSTNEIAYLMGFTEQSSFFRACQRWFQMTPSAYRKRRRSI